MKHELKYQWAMVNAFAKMKQKQGCIITKQSLPEIGVWVDTRFYSASYLIKCVESKSKGIDGLKAA